MSLDGMFMADFETDVAILTIFVHGEKSLKHTGAMVLVSEAETLTRIWKRHPQYCKGLSTVPAILILRITPFTSLSLMAKMGVDLKGTRSECREWTGSWW